MSQIADLLIRAFLDLVSNELIWAQILIHRRQSGFEIRNLVDRNRSAEELRLVPVSDVRQVADVNGAGTFRPLKSAPDLQNGWRIEASDANELEFVVNQLYPGSIPDWYAALTADPPITNYRDFTDRQTGMYRITGKLGDSEAAPVIKACCHETLCLKRRLWSVNNLEPDSPQTKSLIPCLEPCAILLEVARKAVRLDQEERVALPVGAGELATLITATETALACADPTLAAGDLNAPGNRRRLRLLLEKLREMVPPNMS